MRLWPRRKVYLDNLPKTHDLRFMFVFVIAVVVVFGALYGVGYAVAGNKLPNGTRVAEVDVGGKSPEEARTLLQAELDPRLHETIQASIGGKTYKLEPRRMGMSFDYDATLDEATGGSAWDPRHMLHVLLGGDDLEPIVDVDDRALAKTLKKIDKAVSQKPVETTVSFKHATAKVDYGRAGRQLDYQRSGDRLVAALINGEHSVDLAAKDVQPRVTAIQATKFVDKVAHRALRGPIVIRVADSSMTMQPRMFGAALVARSSGGKLQLDVDERRLFKLARGAMAKLPHHPVNARISFTGDRPRVVPGTSGVTVAAPDLAKAVLKAADERGSARVARARVEPDNPKVTTQDIKVLRIKSRVASSTVRYRISPGEVDPAYQLSNLNGLLLQPGQSLSYLDRQPDPGSPAASFVAGLTYQAAFYAGLDTSQHTPARIYSQTLPPGFDAHVEPPATDLLIVNSSPYGVYVRAYVESPGRQSSRARIAHVEMWSTPYWKVKSRSSGRYNLIDPRVIQNPDQNCVARPGIPGFDVDVTRLLTRDGGHRRTERTHATYAVQDEIRCTKRER